MFTFIRPWRHFRQCAKQFILSCLKRLTKVNGWSISFRMTNYCKENTGMVIHTDSFANERRFVCILKCRRTRQTRVVSGWTLLRCLKGNCPWVTDMWASHLLGPHVMDTKAGALRHRSIVLSGWSRVSDGRVAPSHPLPSPPKKRTTRI